MVSDTLLIRNFPCEFSRKDKEDFLKSCGAISVKILDSQKNKYNAAFAKFPSTEMAQAALQNLHQQEMMGTYLNVVFSNKICHIAEKTPLSTASKPQVEEGGSAVLLKRFLEKLNYWAQGTDFRAPVPKHLSYLYPPPSASTLRNIVRLIASTPRLYTQVLNLMNKMNLPCPIGDDLPALGSLPPEFEIPKAEQPTPSLPVPQPPCQPDSSESELSSPDEDPLHKETIPVLRPKRTKSMKRTLAVKPPLPSSSIKTKKLPFDAVFELEVDEPVTKKSKLSKPVEIIDDDSDNAGFGIMQPIKQSMKSKDGSTTDEPICEKPKRDEREEERGPVEPVSAITAEALAANRITERDRAILPVFKNYAEGAPTCRLYVKNLSKQTTEEDLLFIYSRYRATDLEESPDMFDIKHMEKGRMKGQAFVTLQSVDLAKQALAETNGYILNDKPMVVQFARSAVK